MLNNSNENFNKKDINNSHEEMNGNLEMTNYENSSGNLNYFNILRLIHDGTFNSKLKNKEIQSKNIKKNNESFSFGRLSKRWINSVGRFI